MLRIGCFVLAGVLAVYGLFRHRLPGRVPPPPVPEQAEVIRLARLSPADRARWLAGFERKHGRSGRIQALLVEQEPGGSAMVVAQADEEGELPVPWPVPWPIDLTVRSEQANGPNEMRSRHDGRSYHHKSIALPSLKNTYLLVTRWHVPPRRSWRQIGALIAAGLLAAVGLAARPA